MDSDVKWFILLLATFVVTPMIGLGVSEWRKQDCRVELAKTGKTVEEIKAICQ